MARWSPDARGRLEQAALDLFVQQGFDRTTVSEIAGRAGLTRRTFFNHFADKAEVLFWGHDVLREVYVTSIADAPGDVTPFEVLARALGAAAELHQERAKSIRTRHTVISTNPSLQERELHKRALVAGVIAQAMAERGVDAATALLLGEVGSAVFKVAYDAWVVDGSGADLGALVDSTLGRLVATTASPSSVPLLE